MLFIKCLIVFVLTIFPVPVHSNDLEEKISKVYRKFLRAPTYRTNADICSAVQFADHLTTQMSDAYITGKTEEAEGYRHKIQAILVLGMGVGGLSSRQANDKEKEIMLQSLLNTGLYKHVKGEDPIVDIVRKRKISHTYPLGLSQTAHVDRALEIINMAASVSPLLLVLPAFDHTRCYLDSGSRDSVNPLNSLWMALWGKEMTMMTSILDQKYDQQHPVYHALKIAIKTMYDHVATRAPPLPLQSLISPLPLSPRISQEPHKSLDFPLNSFSGDITELPSLDTHSLFIQKFKINSRPLQIVNLTLCKSKAGSLSTGTENLKSFLSKIYESINSRITQASGSMETIITVQKGSDSSDSHEKAHIIELVLLPPNDNWHGYGKTNDQKSFETFTLSLYDHKKYVINPFKKESGFISLGFYTQPSKGNSPLKDRPLFMLVNDFSHRHLTPNALKQSLIGFCAYMRTTPKIIVGEFTKDLSSVSLPPSLFYRVIKKGPIKPTNGLIFYPGST